MEGEQPYLGDLLTMVLNHLLNGMILQVVSTRNLLFQEGSIFIGTILVSGRVFTPLLEYKEVWLAVSTQLKNISQIGPFPQVPVGVKIKNIWNHHPVVFHQRITSINLPNSTQLKRFLTRGLAGEQLTSHIQDLILRRQFLPTFRRIYVKISGSFNNNLEFAKERPIFKAA